MAVSAVSLVCPVPLFLPIALLYGLVMEQIKIDRFIELLKQSDRDLHTGISLSREIPQPCH